MRRHLVFALAAVVFVISAPGAYATRVIFDPPPPSQSGLQPPGGTDCTISIGGLNDYTPCNVNKVNTPYAVSFVDCTTLSGLSSPNPGWCLYLNNVTGGTLNSFRFDFTVPEGGSYDDSNLLHCSSQPAGYATDNCQDDLLLTAGDPLDLTFFAPLANNTDFYLITDFRNKPGYAGVTVSVPEPGALGLFGLGLLVLGVGYGLQGRLRKSRAGRRATAAATAVTD